ncbi:VOC family protein [Legionella hackeliae]|uniref:Putative 4-hydroxyphenylpyruvate dioxygenase n=1 Tax=Legionella hackeliae TaxID=449 RepID=A0A0A8UL88_LEGHA|nr:VOC family protein [Legionella hackeliae]KTD10106.1 4-hydroxyphenylpyruvate dioxygenase [Legionella hackeliae]CEK09595.1 putative 4-hydroxyphenylpyruvate dioxygenase [Legionella hackeliae]STX49506.1 4-hydroxyphenylpyruvate dioxygenase [Legionella hackeliae]
MKQKNATGAIIESIAYIEMYVGNLFQTKNFFTNALKFEHVATKKVEDVVTFLMKQGNIHILLTSSLNHNTHIAKHVNEFGDSVKKISFFVHDVAACFEGAVSNGAKPVFSPQDFDGAYAASVEVFNKVEHEFLQMNPSHRIPGFKYNEHACNKNPMIYNIDHIATCHPKNTIDKWVKFYKDTFSFSENTDEDIHSEESGMHITIMKSPNGKVNLPLVEPSSERSPLHTYLKYNYGAGVHHIAFQTDDIIASVKHYEHFFGELRKAPPSYYDEVKELYPEEIKRIEKVAPYGIMLEQDVKGILFQIFTKPVVTRPTLFLEFVQREVCEGFGTVNIKALYETLEA